MKRSLFCLGLVAISSFSMAGQLSIVSVRPCLPADGSPGAPPSGGYLGVRVDWTVTGTMNRPFMIRFRMANQTRDILVSDLGPGANWRYVTWKLPLDSNIPISAVLDPYNVTDDTNNADDSKSTKFNPAAPSTAIAYYEPRDLRATNTVRVNIPASANYSRVQIIQGAPTSEGSQSILSLTPPGGSQLITTNPFSIPVRIRNFTNPINGTFVECVNSFDVKARNVRLAPTRMTGATWTAIDALPANIKVYLNAEATIQSTHATIGSYVNAILGSNYKTTMTPMEASRQLFQAVLGTLAFTPTPSGNALTALNSGLGDAGGFTMLYVACLRRAGIPARMVWGWQEGNNLPTAWVESYMPGTGWIPHDPAMGEAWNSSGDYPYCFAVLPDLNARVAVCKGSTQVLPDYTINGIQIGAYGYFGSSVVPTWTWATTLGPKP